MSCKDCFGGKKCKECEKKTNNHRYSPISIKKTFGNINCEKGILLFPPEENSQSNFALLVEELGLQNTVIGYEECKSDCPTGILLFPGENVGDEPFAIILDQNDTATFVMGYQECKDPNLVQILGDVGKTNIRFTFDAYYKYCTKYLNINYSLPDVPASEFDIQVVQIIDLPPAQILNNDTMFLIVIERFLYKIRFEFIKKALSPITELGDIRNRIADSIKFDSRIFSEKRTANGKIEVVLNSYISETANKSTKILDNIKSELLNLIFQAKILYNRKKIYRKLNDRNIIA